jgi:hypothetical protein
MEWKAKLTLISNKNNPRFVISYSQDDFKTAITETFDADLNKDEKWISDRAYKKIKSLENQNRATELISSFLYSLNNGNINPELNEEEEDEPKAPVDPSQEEIFLQYLNRYRQLAKGKDLGLHSTDEVSAAREELISKYKPEFLKLL